MNRALADLHTHSVLSGHAFSSFTENIEYAAEQGLKLYGISEHQSDELGIGAHPFAFSNYLKVAPREYRGMKIMMGVELNILDEGFRPCGMRIERMDYAIASMHAYVYDPKEHDSVSNTRNYLAALDHEKVKIIGHMDDPRFPCDYEKVIRKARDLNRLIELNNASLNPLSSRRGAEEIDHEILRLCREYRCQIILSSDAHIKYDIGNFDLCYKLLEGLAFPDELIANYDIPALEKILQG